MSLTQLYFAKLICIMALLHITTGFVPSQFWKFQKHDTPRLGFRMMANVAQSDSIGSVEGLLSQRRIESVRRRWAGSESILEDPESMTVSRHKLDTLDVKDYQGDSLFCRIARVVCNLDGLIPRKELHENWEVAIRINAHFPSTRRVADLAGGNSLLGWMLLLLDSTGRLSVLCVDKIKPSSACTLTDAFVAEWPHLRSRHRFVEGDLGDLEPKKGALLVSLHGCGRLTDRVIELACQACTSIALVPCCHSLAGTRNSLTVTAHPRGASALAHIERMSARTSVDVAVDAARVAMLRSKGYAVSYARIPEDITPKNRMILARAQEAEADDGAMWPTMKLPRMAWSWAKNPSQGGQHQGERQGITEGDRRILDWGGLKRRDSFLHARALPKGLMCYVVPEGDTHAANAAQGQLRALGVQGVLLDGRCFFSLGEEGWSRGIQGLMQVAQVYAVVALKEAPSRVLGEKGFAEEAATWSWDVVKQACEAGYGGGEVSKVRVSCKKANNGWRPLTPPQMQSVCQLEMQRALNIDARPRDASPGQTGADRCEGGIVRLWLTDSYVCGAFRLTANVQTD